MLSNAINIIGSSWQDYFFRKEDLRICNVLRIGFAILLSINLITLLPYLDFWFTESGAMPIKAAIDCLDPDADSFLFYLPDTYVPHAFLLMISCCMFLAIGILPRFQALLLFLGFNSVQHRALLLFDGEDVLFKLFAFYLFLMPLKQAASKDKVTRNQEIWPIRLLQLQYCLLYLSTALEKLSGVHWQTGISLYFVSRLDDLFIYRAWIAPIFDSMIAIKVLTWSTLAFELSIPILLVWNRTRRVAIVCAIVFHLSLAFTMNLFLFQYLMILGLMSFLHPQELAAIGNYMRRLLKRNS